MKRRELFKAIGASMAGVSLISAPTARKYGRITVEGWNAHKEMTGEELVVYYNGVELQSVYEADDIEGYACVYCRDAKQHADLMAKDTIHLDDHRRVCNLRVTGDVRMAPKANT